MPDPYGRYANLMARHPHLKSTVVNTPNIRDQNGAMILPSDYSQKLGNQTPVFVTVKLRLWVLSLSYYAFFLFQLLKIHARWEIPPQSEEKRATSGFKTRDGEENGSRIYQILLHDMCLLPSNNPAKNRVSHKVTNENASIKGPNPQAGVNVTVDKGKKRDRESESDEGRTESPKVPRPISLTPYDSDPDIEMTDDVSD